MVNANDFTPFFGNIDKTNEDKIKVELLKSQLAQEQAEFQRKLMGIIATTLANTGSHFSIQQSYDIKIMDDNTEHQELKQEVESLVKKYGLPINVYTN